MLFRSVFSQFSLSPSPNSMVCTYLSVSTHVCSLTTHMFRYDMRRSSLPYNFTAHGLPGDYAAVGCCSATPVLSPPTQGIAHTHHGDDIKPEHAAADFAAYNHHNRVEVSPQAHIYPWMRKVHSVTCEYICLSYRRSQMSCHRGYAG